MATAKKLPSGNWRVLVYTGLDENKKRRYESFTESTKKEAEYAAAQYGIQIHKSDCNLTFGEALDKQIESKSAVLAPSTVAEYERSRNTDLQGIIDIPICDLTQDIIQKEINREAKTHSPKTIRNMHGRISSVLHAYRPELVLETQLSQKIKPDIVIPTEAQIKIIYPIVKDTDMERPFLLASQVGLRASEICGLPYRYVYPLMSAIEVRQAKVHSGKGTSIKPPKSYAGNRKLTCSPFLIERLGTGEPDEFVVNANPGILTKRWAHVLIKAGIPHFKFHALRHYFASQAILQGIPPAYVAEMMGHSTTDMVDKVYKHIFPAEVDKFAKLMANKTNELCNTKCNTKKKKP